MIERGDRVDLFGVYQGWWVWRGSGLVEWVSGGLVYVVRERGHGVAAISREAIGCTIAVKEIPLDKNCQCLLPCHAFPYSANEKPQ